MKPANDNASPAMQAGLDARQKQWTRCHQALSRASRDEREATTLPGNIGRVPTGFLERFRGCLTGLDFVAVPLTVSTEHGDGVCDGAAEQGFQPRHIIEIAQDVSLRELG